jgi:subtilisin family serine protease
VEAPVLIDKKNNWSPVPPAKDHQRLLSANSTNNLPLSQQGYGYYSPAGEGITVYVLDSGFNVSNQDLVSKEKIEHCSEAY